MSESNILALVLPIVIPLLVGRFIIWCKLLHPIDSKVLSTLFLYVFFPSLIIGLLALENFKTLLDFRFMLANLGLTLILYVGLLVLHKLLLGRSISTSSQAAFVGSKINAGILGVPILLSLIKHHAAVATATNLLIGYLTITPLTILLLNLSHQSDVNQRQLRALLLRTLKQSMTHPILLATFIGLCLSAGAISLPLWLRNTLRTLGDGTIPAALIATGMSLNVVGLGKQWGEIVWMSVVRLILSPLIAILAANWLNLSPVFAIALVVSFSLPTAAMTLPLAQEYKVYEECTAGIITLTTLAFLVTFPLIVWLSNLLWPGVIQAS